MKIKQHLREKDRHGNTNATLLLHSIGEPLAIFVAFVAVCLTVKIIFF